MECLKCGQDISLKRSIQTSIANCHTVTYKALAPADNPAQLEFNCSGHSDHFIDLDSTKLLLQIKLVKTDGNHLNTTDKITVGCVNNLLHTMIISLSVSLNGYPITLHETNYFENFLNYVSDASDTHLVSRFWIVDSPGELKSNSGYVTRLTYLDNSHTIELYGRLHADLLNSDKMLINGVDMTIKLPRAPDAFICWDLQTIQKYELKY
jgi:hypothetical protein